MPLPNQNPAMQGLIQAAGGGPIPTAQSTPPPTPGGPGILPEGYPVGGPGILPPGYPTNPQWTAFAQALRNAGVNKIKGNSFPSTPSMPAITGLQNSMQNNLNSTITATTPNSL